MQRQQSRPTSPSKVFLLSKIKYVGIALIRVEAPIWQFSHLDMLEQRTIFIFKFRFSGGSRIAKWGGSVGTAPLSQPDSRLVGRMGGRMSPSPGLHPHCTSRRCPLRTETVQTRQAAPNSYSPLRREQSSFARSPPVALQRILVAPSDF